MKKFTLFSKLSLLLLSVTLIFSACTEEKYFPTEEIYIDNPTDWDIDYKTVSSSAWAWKYDSAKDAGFYMYTISMSQLTGNVVKDGGIIVAQDLGGDVFRPLPYTSYEVDDKGQTYGITVDYEYEPGYIHFYYTYSDLYDGTPPTMTFKVTSFY